MRIAASLAALSGCSLFQAGGQQPAQSDSSGADLEGEAAEATSEDVVEPETTVPIELAYTGELLTGANRVARADGYDRCGSVSQKVSDAPIAVLELTSPVSELLWGASEPAGLMLVDESDRAHCHGRNLAAGRYEVYAILDPDHWNAREVRFWFAEAEPELAPYPRVDGAPIPMAERTADRWVIGATYERPIPRATAAREQLLRVAPAELFVWATQTREVPSGLQANDSDSEPPERFTIAEGEPLLKGSDRTDCYLTLDLVQFCSSSLEVGERPADAQIPTEPREGAEWAPRPMLFAEASPEHRQAADAMGERLERVRVCQSNARLRLDEANRGVRTPQQREAASRRHVRQRAACGGERAATARNALRDELLQARRERLSQTMVELAARFSQEE